MRLRIVWLGLILLANTLPQPASAQDEMFCAISDSTEAYAAGLDNISHLFGSDTVTWPHEFNLASTFPAFDQVFRLHLTNHVSGRFSTPQWQSIIASIMSNDTTATDDDVFGRVWSYFLRSEADSNSAHAGVRYRVYSTTYTKIHIYMYDTADLPNPCTADYGVACKGYSSYAGDRLVINASSNNSVEVIVGCFVSA